MSFSQWALHALQETFTVLHSFVLLHWNFRGRISCFEYISEKCSKMWGLLYWGIPDNSPTDNSPTDNSPTDHSPTGQFPDRTTPRTDISPTGQFPDRTFPRPDNSPTGQFPDRQFPERTIPRTDNSPINEEMMREISCFLIKMAKGHWTVKIYISVFLIHSPTLDNGDDNVLLLTISFPPHSRFICFFTKRTFSMIFNLNNQSLDFCLFYWLACTWGVASWRVHCVVLKCI